MSPQSGNNTSFAVDVTATLTSHTTRDWFRFSSLYVALATCAVAIIIVVILVGNSLVIVAIWRDPILKQRNNWFIASLAVSDLLLGLLVMPFSLANELMGFWVFGDILCELWLAIDVLLCTASILNLCLISVDRYLTITRPIDYPQTRTPCNATLMITAVWVLSAFICFPPLVGWKRPQPRLQPDHPLCTLSSRTGYVVYSTTLSFFLPLLVMLFVYLKIYVAARNRARKNIRSSRAPATHTTNSRNVRRASSRFADTGRCRGREEVGSSNSHSNSSGPVDASSSVSQGDPIMEQSNGVDRSSAHSDDASRTRAATLCVITSRTNSLQTNAGPAASNHQPSAIPRSENSIALQPSEVGLLANQKQDRDERFDGGTPNTVADSISHADQTPNEERIIALEEAVVDGEEISAEDSESSSGCANGRTGERRRSENNSETTQKPRERNRRAEGEQSRSGSGGIAATIQIKLAHNPPPLSADGHLTQPHGNSTSSSHLQVTVATAAAGEQRAPVRWSLTSATSRRRSRETRRSLNEAERHKRKIARTRERRATVVLGIIVVTFVACWLPFFGTYLLSTLLGFSIPDLAFAVMFWAGYCNSALNPIIYTIFNHDFRRAFHKLLCPSRARLAKR